MSNPTPSPIVVPYKRSPIQQRQQIQYTREKMCGTKRRFIAVVSVIISLASVGAFVLPYDGDKTTTMLSHSQIDTMLGAKAPLKKYSKDKKKLGPKTTRNAFKKNRSTREVSTQQLMTTTTTTTTSPSKKKTKSAPPWQVLSVKDAQRNVDSEKKRRENIQLGRASTSDESKANSNGKEFLSKAFLDESEAKFLKWRRFNPTTVPKQQHFVGAYLNNQMPPRLGVPEIAFLGRSNVGKSSLLNRLTNRVQSGGGDMARVGKTPGATASVNLYTLQDIKGRDILGWVDLPGFGYARLSKSVQESVQRAAELYLHRRKELALGILLVDIRRRPSSDDRAVLAALYDRGVPILVVATKRDKISSQQEQEQLLTIIQDELGLPEHQPLSVSSVTGEGCRELWRIILEACEDCVNEIKSKYDENVNIEEEEEYDDYDDDKDTNDTCIEQLEEHHVFDDSDEDYVYDQGYDWIHANDYEHDEFDVDENDNADAEFADATMTDLDEVQPQRETLKSLKKRARDMERRGEV